LAISGWIGPYITLLFIDFFGLDWIISGSSANVDKPHQAGPAAIFNFLPSDY
jgi:hypothetical protein